MNNNSSCSDDDIEDNNIEDNNIENNNIVEYEDNNEIKLYKTYYVDLLGGNIKSFLKKSKLTQFINNCGIDINDKRFNNNIKNLNEKISFKDFIDLMNSNIILFKKIFENDLIISDWVQLKNTINIIYNNTKNINSGKKADYIPQLNNVDENLYAVSLCSVDGQIYNLGDTDYDFCVQSCSKPITYLIGCDLNNSEQIHNFVGTEPSGRNFNELCLNEYNIPHNPLINSGAIMCASLIDYENSLANRFDTVMKYWSKLAGNTKINFSTSVYLSERASADRNNCLAYMMQEKKSFSIGMNKKYERNWSNNNLNDTLDFYFQCCSIEINCTQASIISCTLANGGICPITNERVFSNEIVKNALSLMSSCGMYDYSGEWAYKIGLPSKSGVSGIIMTIIPEIMGIATFSPTLDTVGNSVKGIEFFTQLSKKYSFHIYDNILTDKTKYLITKKNIVDNQFNIYSLLLAASNGDLNSIIILYSKGIDLNSCDYDKRTALHLACSEGQIEIIKYLISKNVNTNVIDRWNNTPFDDFNKFLQNIETITPIDYDILELLKI